MAGSKVIMCDLAPCYLYMYILKSALPYLFALEGTADNAP